MKNKESIKTIICFGLALFSQILFLAGNQKMRQVEDKVWLTRFNSENEITAEMVRRLQRENERTDAPTAFAAWNEKKNEEVAVQELNKSTFTTAVAVTERADLIFPDSRTFDRAYPNTCIISEGLACSLFGSADVKNLHIVYNEQKYKIQDIIKGSRNLFLYYGNSESAHTFTEITAAGSPDKSQKMIKDQLEERLGVRLRCIDYSFPHFICGAAFLVYVLILCRSLYRHWKRRDKESINVILILVLIAAGTVICTQLPGIPRDIVPTHFSDREFWSTLIEEQKNNLEFMFSKEKFYPEKAWFAGLFLAVSGLAASVLSWRKLSKRKALDISVSDYFKRKQREHE